MVYQVCRANISFILIFVFTIKIRFIRLPQRSITTQRPPLRFLQKRIYRFMGYMKFIPITNMIQHFFLRCIVYIVFTFGVIEQYVLKSVIKRII